MASQERKSFLPTVEEADLLALVFEDATNPTHQKRWNHFARTNPILAREVLKRAIQVGSIAANDTKGGLSSLETQKTITDTASFIIAALEQAAKRHHNREEIFIDGDGGDADQLP